MKPINLLAMVSPSEEELHDSLSYLTEDERICIEKVMEKDRLLKFSLSNHDDRLESSFILNSLIREKIKNSFEDEEDLLSLMEDDQHMLSQRSNALLFSIEEIAASNGLNLEFLNEEEKYKIFEVLWRENVHRLYTEQKVSRLKTELAMLKKKGILRVDSSPSTTIWSPDPSRTCGRCRAELGRIMNRGAYCKSCKVKVCKSCREYGIKGTEWVCNVCHKNIEIKVASGDWVNDYLNRIPVKKKNSKLMLPGTSFDITKKKNIKRSWTISNPSGTPGPQLPVRRLSSGDPELKSFAKVDSSIIHDDLSPKIAPPVFMPVPQVPIQNYYRNRPRGNLPIRSQSMSQADSDRFFSNTNSGRQPRYPHRHDYYRRPSQSYEESSSENDDGPPWSSTKKYQRDMRRFSGYTNTNSLDRRKQRRSTPSTVSRPHPSHSLPRPPKRTSEQEEPRQTVREPTPDYDDSVISSVTKESLRVKSDSGVDESTSSSTKTNGEVGKSYYGSSEGRTHTSVERKRIIEEEKKGRCEDITLSDLESTRVDDYGSIAEDLEEEEILRRGKGKPHEANDFKLVFISSCDSSKESELNPGERIKEEHPPKIPPKRNKLLRPKLKEDSLLSDSEKISLSSPSVSTVRTSKATRDPASPLNGSPGRVPKIRNIPIVRKDETDAETSSQDAEVRNILKDSRYFQTIRQREYHRVSLIADVCSLATTATSPNRSLSESDLSEIQDYLLRSNNYLSEEEGDGVEEGRGIKEAGRNPGSGPPPPSLPPKTRQKIKGRLLETFVDEQPTKVQRSSSNVGSALVRNKPVRRSKSYRGQKSVTNINFEDTEFGGSHTLPKKKPATVHYNKGVQEEDDEVIITREGANFVRIQIGPTATKTAPSQTPEIVSNQRKYTLEELEVEGFPPPSEGSSDERPEEVDLNSLIEGDVDEDSLKKASDTEADFLDKDGKRSKESGEKIFDSNKRKETLEIASLKLGDSLTTSDSASTTSASYVIQHSDEDEEENKIRSGKRLEATSMKEPGEKDEAVRSPPLPPQPPLPSSSSSPSSSVSSSLLSSPSLNTCAHASSSQQLVLPNISECQEGGEENPRNVSQLIAKFEQNTRSDTPKIPGSPYAGRGLPREENEPEGHLNSPIILIDDEKKRRKKKKKSSSSSSIGSTSGLLLLPSSSSQEIPQVLQEENTLSYQEREEEDTLEEDLPLGAEASSVASGKDPTFKEEEEGDYTDEETPPMAPTVRRNSNGAYTSYVFISSNPGADDNTSSSDRVTVNAGGPCVMTVQDGRASNISIVSTESSDLGSPTNGPQDEDEDERAFDSPSPPDVPMKLGKNSRPEYIDGQRTRGGETVALPATDPDELDSFDPNAQDGGEGLANYFTNSLEASSAPSRRRTRPSIIRSSRRIEEEKEENDENHFQDISYEENFHIAEVNDKDTERSERESFDEEDPYSDEYNDRYDVEYDDEDDDYLGYPMCQPVYDDSDYSESELLSSGDEDGGGDREEELRGYNRAIDFTLHTIIEESCEDSESDSGSNHHQERKRQSDPSELEKYFYYGVGGGEDLESESSFSDEHQVSSLREPSYGMSQSENESVGSESDGKSYSSSKKKKFIRTKRPNEGESSSGATEDDDDDDDLSTSSSSFNTKKIPAKRRSSAGDAERTEELPKEQLHLPVHPIIGRVQPIDDQRVDISSPVNGPVRKHKSRDSGFVGSCDDLLRNESSSHPHINTDSAPSLPSDDGTTDSSIKLPPSSPRLEKLSEISEHVEEHKEEEENKNKLEEKEGFIRKESFQNWSSDEDANIKIIKMHNFFETFSENVRLTRVNPQFEIYEERLHLIAKSVPNLDEEHIKEIISRLAHEEIWKEPRMDYSFYADEEELLYSKISGLKMDIFISETSLRILSSKLVALVKDSSKTSSHLDWGSSWKEESNFFPKLTLLPTEAKTTSIPRDGLRHTTNSLPRLGTSSIQKSKPNVLLETSTSPTTGQARSARYRPPGYKPLPVRKISPSIITSSTALGSTRKFSSESGILGRFLDDANNDLSSKSGTPSPIIAREIRESSVCSRSSADTVDDGEVPNRDERFPSPFTKHGSLTNLGVRSESMASVYSQGEGRYGTVVVRGDIEFSIVYANGYLEIAVKQCKDLAAVDIKRNRSDPYVKVYLLPDKSKSGKRKTKVKKHTLNPIFDETLKYQMSLNEIEKRTMWLTVWHSDMFGRNDFLGEVMLPLSGVDLEDTVSRWHSLQDRTEPLGADDMNPSTMYRGELIVALKFASLSEIRGKVSKVKGTLQILIKEGKNLVPPKGSNNVDAFCKCYLLPGKGLKQKTSVCRRTNKPKWEQTVSWEDVTLAELSDRSLEITVWDHDRLGHNEMIGGLRFNNGSGKHQHRHVNWMDSTGKEVTLWQQMLERPNFWVEGSVHLRPSERMTSPSM